METLGAIDYSGCETAEQRWAAQREYHLRWRRYRLYRIGAFGVLFEGVNEAMRRLGAVLSGHE